MKFQFVIILLFFALISCNNNSEQADAKKETAAQIANDTHDEHAGHNHDGHDHAGHSHADDSGNLLVGAYIGIWKYHHSSTQKKNAYINHWIEMKRDMTFEYGIGSKTTNRGKWMVVEEKGDTYLDLDYENNTDRADEKWRAQMNNPVLVLIGNSDKMISGEIIKIDKIEKRPTDK